MVKFKATIQKFQKKGEKTGWSYIEIDAPKARKLNPGSKVSFRVKGRLDAFEFEGMALLPMGKGDFILPLKADVRKKIQKKQPEVAVRSSEGAIQRMATRDFPFWIGNVRTVDSVGIRLFQNYFCHEIFPATTL